MKTLLLIIVLFVVNTASANVGMYQISLEGLPQKTIDNLTHKFESLKLKQSHLAEIDQMIRFLINVEQFDSAWVTEDSPGHLTFHVNQTTKVRQIKIKGNDYLSESEIRKELSYSERSAFSETSIIESGEKISQIYRDLGYLSAKIEVELNRVSATEMDISLLIIEGSPTRISEVQIISDNPKLKVLTEKLLRKKRGEILTNLSLTEIRKDVREVLSENRFYKSELSEPQITLKNNQKEANLSYQVTHSDQFSLEIEGSDKISESALKSKALRLESYYSANPNIAAEFANRIKAYYLSEGYARVETQGSEIEIAPFEKRIQIQIQEGPRVQIQSLSITGRYSQNENYYKKFLFEKSGDRTAKKIFVKDELESGYKNLIIDRQNDGFLKAKIISTRTIYNKDKDQVSMTVNFDEGPLTKVHRISFDGNVDITEDQLLNVINLKPLEPLRLNLLEESVSRMKEYYRNLGYLEMSITNEKEDLVQYNEDSTLAQVRFRIYEGPKIQVGAILVEGNTLTKDYVIRKELEFEVGQTLTPQAIEESISRLQRLGHFSSVEIKTLEEKTQISKRTILVRVRDRDPGIVNFGVGATNERTFTIRGYTGIAYRNILGTGRGASARIDGNYNLVDIKYLERKVTLGYTEPYLFDTRIRGRVNFTQAVTVTSYAKKTASEVRQTTWTVEQDITSHILLSWDLSFAHYEDFYINSNGPSTSLDIGSTGPSLEVDFRDHPFNPSKGSLSRLSLEYGTPKLTSDAEIEYLRTYGSFTHYYSFIPQVVWANSIRGGYIKNIGNAPNSYTPYDKKGFQLGGLSTVRGYQPDEAFPNARDLGTDQYRLTTEATMALYKTELRFPLWPHYNLAGAVFYDRGAVFIKDHNFDDPWRDSTGIAARYMTPIGIAVTFEYAWKLDAKGSRNEDPSVLHFSIGTF
ncbi:MAG: hypothetical protein BroJett040_02960 [Oligoflexia bacterium]|nr:MAG: hypothetical protein BroJett040_02960 [Oligoflexia bacterium]